MKKNQLLTKVEPVVKLAGKMLTGPNKRAFMAEVADSFCEGSPRQTELYFGFKRHAVALGLHEKRTGLICYGHYQPCGRRRVEVDHPELEADIRRLADPESQADPPLRNTFAYTRLTAESIRQKLTDEMGWQDEQLPTPRAFNDILNRLVQRLLYNYG